jgi:hypothetical protein
VGVPRAEAPDSGAAAQDELSPSLFVARAVDGNRDESRHFQRTYRM